ITNTYYKLSEYDPAFIWFAGATIGSGKVGENIYFSGNGSLLNQSETLSTLVTNNTPINTAHIQNFYDYLPFGNQKIFTNLLPIYLTYKEIGIDGLNALKEYDINSKILTKEI